MIGETMHFGFSYVGLIYLVAECGINYLILLPWEGAGP